MNRLSTFVALAIIAPFAAAQAVIKPVGELTWADAGVPGVSNSAVDGNMTKGPSHFYLRYASGFVAPPHYHSADHYVTIVTGTVVLIIDGKEHRLMPGSFASLKKKAVHAAGCETGADCVMFIDARGRWDAVMKK